MGAVEDGELCRALLDMFIGEQPMDQGFRWGVGGLGRLLLCLWWSWG